MTTLLLILSLTFPALAAHRGPGVHQRVAMGALHRRCEGGSGEACSSYAKMLRLYGTKAERERSHFFMRKACRMSYQPACPERGPIRRIRRPK